MSIKLWQNEKCKYSPLSLKGSSQKAWKLIVFVFHCFFSTYVAFPSGTSYNIMVFEICKFPWCCSSVLWPLPIYWMWIVHHINANLQSIREALCCVVLCPKLSNFDSSATCPLLLQSFLQYLHIHQLIVSAQSTKYIVFIWWVSSLKIPLGLPQTPVKLAHRMPYFSVLGILIV